jgi:hypothetical protein
LKPIIEVSNKFVSIRPHFDDVLLQHYVRGRKVREKSRFERNRIRDDLGPMVFASQVTEELAPLKDGDVKEVAIRVDPKLFVASWLANLVPGSVERQITKAVAAEYSKPTKTLAASHE